MPLRLQVERLEARELLSGDPPADPFLLTPVDGSTPLALHIHPRLHLFFDGQAVVIPANVGVFQTSALPIHTHDASGILHVESPIARIFFLEDFLTIWKQTPQGRAIVDQLHAAQTSSTTVNGQASANFDALVLHDHDDIVIRAQSRAADQGKAANQTFVAQIYRDLLHREPDPNGWATFRAALDAGVSRAQVVQVIESSTAYRQLQVQQI